MPGLKFFSWHGVWGPKGLPQPIVDRVAAALAGMARDPAVVAPVASLGFDLVAESSTDFARCIEADVARNAAVLKAAVYKPE